MAAYLLLTVCHILRYYILYSQKVYEVDPTVIPILLTRKLRCGELKWLPKVTLQVWVE